jgi:hypothetical protein
MSNFDELKAALNATDDMVKALPAETDEDVRVKAAAAEGGAKTEVEEPAKTEVEEPDDMAKSFEVTLADGTKVQAMDGTEMMKALGGKIDALTGALTQSVGLTQTLIERIKHDEGLIAGYGSMVKSLQDEVKAIGNTGRGRVGAITVAEKLVVGAGGGAAKAPTGHEIMAKAMDLQSTGKIDARGVALIESSVNMGRGIPSPFAHLFVAAA